MKKILLTTIVLFTVFTGFSQRFAYVNTEYILSNMAEFSDAQKKVDTFSEDWRAEIARQQKDIDDTYRAFQNEQYLLTEDVKKSRIQEIENKERAIKNIKSKVWL
ncbi:MAG: OmpH family outer membrane protein [Bacteroidetes bacterium]|nr:OmpH family outer membrane protein [Bacteroidota bacterium]